MTPKCWEKWKEKETMSGRKMDGFNDSGDGRPSGQQVILEKIYLYGH